jgi:hypothetical protein
MAPVSREIHNTVIVVKFNFAKGLPTPSPNSWRTEAENIGATERR